MSALHPPPEMPNASGAEIRLVLLGHTGVCSTGVCSILDRPEPQPEPQPGTSSTQETSRHRGPAAGRQVSVVSGPDWFSSDFDPEERKKHISSFITFSSPGPHAFLLCVPVNQPAEGESKALDVLEELFGPSAVGAHTIILFTHMEELEEDEQLETYLSSWRRDLQVMLQRCSHRYHTLETRSGEADERKAVEEMLEKVEQMVRDSGGQHFSCPLYQQTEERLRQRQLELLRRRRGDDRDHHSPSPQETVAEEDMEAVREEAERSIGDLDVDVGGLFPSGGVSPPSAVSSFLQGLLQMFSSWMKWLPRFVRREALLGALVGLFVGGPAGGMVGATVGSVATEVTRRKTEKNKSK